MSEISSIILGNLVGHEWFTLTMQVVNALLLTHIRFIFVIFEVIKTVVRLGACYIFIYTQEALVFGQLSI